MYGMIQYTQFLTRLNQAFVVCRHATGARKRRGVHIMSCRKISEEKNLRPSLYVPGNKAMSANCIISPYMDFSQQFENVSDLKDDISQRGLDANIDNIISKWTKWRELEKQKSRLEDEKKEVAKKTKRSKKVEDRQQGREVNKQLKELQGELWQLQDSFIVPALQLPNNLHPSTSRVDKFLFSLQEKPEFSFPPKSHMELGKETAELEFTDISPTAYYLKKNLAVLELACSDYFLSAFKELNYQLQSNPGLVKAVVMEGCGAHYQDRHKFNKLCARKGDLDENSRHITGGGSVPAFAAHFAKHIVENPDCLPLKLVTVARNYVCTNSEDPGLLGCRQSTVVDGYVVHEADSVCEAQLLDELLITVIINFANLGLHFKVIQYSAPKLSTHESAAIGIQMFSTSTGKYHEVGRIAVCGDYISKRLWTLCSSQPKTCSFLSVIHIRICHITRLLGLLMENQQKEDGSYIIPNCLQTILSGTYPSARAV